MVLLFLFRFAFGIWIWSTVSIGGPGKPASPGSKVLPPSIGGSETRTGLPGSIEGWGLLACRVRFFHVPRRRPSSLWKRVATVELEVERGSQVVFWELLWGLGTDVRNPENFGFFCSGWEVSDSVGRFAMFWWDNSIQEPHSRKRRENNIFYIR